MGAAPSTPRKSSQPQDTVEYLIGTFVGDRSYPVTSDFWQKLIELPLTVQWPEERVQQACGLFAQNNSHTRHLAKILIHLAWSLQEAATGSFANYAKAVNAAYLSSIFLKHLIENSKSDNFENLQLSLLEGETDNAVIPKGDNIAKFVMHSVLRFISATDVSADSCFVHHELLNFMLIAMSTQLCSVPSPDPAHVHPFIDAAMAQESSLVCSVVRKLLLNYVSRTRIPFMSSGYPVFPEDNRPGVLQRFGSVAANFVLLPYYTFNYLVSSTGDGSRSPIADNSLLVLLVLIHYRKCIEVDICSNDGMENARSKIYMKENSIFSENLYYIALQNAKDVEFDRLDMGGNAQNGPLVRLSFASLFDMLGLCLSDESSILLLYSLIHGNSDFLEYVLVRTDLDTLLMPILETLYNASKRTSNQIYMLLIVLLILSQDSSFNASIHKLVLPVVPWYQERLLNNSTLGSLMVVVLIRTVKYNLSKLRDIYLHTNCLAILANMAPHVHRISAYASQRLVSLFDMLAHKYTKLAELGHDQNHKYAGNRVEGTDMTEDVSPELHIYTDFLRIVLEIINAILTYALPRNPEVVYAIMHRQEVFHPFKNHPRFSELLENIYTVIDFFNSRMDTQQTDGEWSVDKVLQVIIVNCRSWRCEGMKMFTQLKFTYEQENQPEEFFIPYVWQLILSTSGVTFDPLAAKLIAPASPQHKSTNTSHHLQRL